MANKRGAAALAKAHESARRIANNAREHKADFVRKGSSVIGAYLIGSAETSGRLAQLPQVAGMPRVLTLAAVGQVASMAMGKGTAREVVAGLAEAATSISFYQLGKGGTLSGVGAARRVGAGVSSSQLERELRSMTGVA